MAKPQPESGGESLLTAWGSSPIPPMTLSMLVGGLHFKPFQMGPSLFILPLALSSYISLAGYKIDAAGFGAAWSGIYALLAFRRRQTLRRKVGFKGALRGTAIGLGTANCVAGGWVYFTGDRVVEANRREVENRWGQNQSPPSST